jgi:ElaB/YqjD/DUF883 family membrane-anchored ribosome-binding protein
MFETDPNDQFKRDLRRLADDLSELKSYWLGGSRMPLEKIKNEAKYKWEQATKEIQAKAKQTDQYVHDRPWAAVGIAAALGSLLGLLLFKRHR